MTTMFSGVECAGHSWKMLAAAALHVFNIHLCLGHGHMVECNRACQKTLKATWPGVCLFGDILAFTPSATARKMTLHKTAPCLTHGRNCSIDRPVWLDVSGPPCVLWSRLHCTLMSSQ